MIKRTIFISLTLFISHITYGQSDYDIFRQAITEMYITSQAKKANLEKEVEESEKKVSKYRNDKPSISVFGGTPEQNKKIEEDIIEFTDSEISNEIAIVDVPPPPPPPVPKEKQKKDDGKKTTKKKDELTYIEYVQKPMFPNKPEGKKLMSQSERAKQPKEKIEWVEGPTFTSTETIYIDDIKDPIERQKAKDIGSHNGNIIELNRISFIEAIYNESKTKAGFDKMLKDFSTHKIDFSKNFKTIKALDGNEKVEYIKGKLQDLVNKI